MDTETKPRFERDKIYKMRNGKEVRVICVDALGDWPIRTYELGTGRSRAYTADGSYAGGEEESVYDLLPGASSAADASSKSAPIFERDKVYKMRNGHEVRVVCVDAPGIRPIVSVRLRDGSVIRHMANGKLTRGSRESVFDLMPPEPPYRYVNVYRRQTTCGFYSALYETLSDAETAMKGSLTECVARVRFKEGQFDG